MGYESWVSSHGSQVMGLLNRATTFGFNSFLAQNHWVGGHFSVKGVIRQYTTGCIHGWGLWSF